MENENKRCRGCKYFSRYYTRGEKKFSPTKYGWCCKGTGTVNAGDGCEKFERKSHKRGTSESVKENLSALLAEIGELRKLVEAGREDEEV